MNLRRDTPWWTLEDTYWRLRRGAGWWSRKIVWQMREWILNPSTSEIVLETGLCSFLESRSSVSKLHPQISPWFFHFSLFGIFGLRRGSWHMTSADLDLIPTAYRISLLLYQWFSIVNSFCFYNYPNALLFENKGSIIVNVMYLIAPSSSLIFDSAVGYGSQDRFNFYCKRGYYGN